MNFQDTLAAMETPGWLPDGQQEYFHQVDVDVHINMRWHWSFLSLSRIPNEKLLTFSWSCPHPLQLPRQRRGKDATAGELMIGSCDHVMTELAVSKNCHCFLLILELFELCVATLDSYIIPILYFQSFAWFARRILNWSSGCGIQEKTWWIHRLVEKKGNWMKTIYYSKGKHTRNTIYTTPNWTIKSPTIYTYVITVFR